MALPKEQIEQIKQQLFQQIESTFPEDKKELAKQQIEAMNSEQLEAFLKQNKLMKTQVGASQGQCVFCSIVSEDVQSYKIGEDKNSIAILEINPISKAHTIIIPKEHISSSDKLPKEIFSFSKEIAKKIKTKFKPKDIIISSANLFGHEIINILPVYKNETLNSEKHQAKPEDLQKLQEFLNKEKPKIIKKAKPKKLDLKKLWLPKRIP